MTSSLRRTLEMIKFSHSVFALPFALLAAVLAAGGWPSRSALFWIVVAMVGARSAAMAHNRIADRSIDAANPRTASRHLPAGTLSVGYARAFLIASAAVFIVAASQLNTLAFALSPVALGLLLLYSYTKRFTVWSHVVLGVCLGMAPVGAWIAVRGRFDLAPVLLGAAVVFWTAGFDIIYSLQDERFDREAGLFSLPARAGARRALQISLGFHILFLVLLAVVWRLVDGGWLFGAGIVAIGAAIAWQHHVVRPNDLSRVDAAFFTANGIISAVFAAAGILDRLLR
jgi:4-hydroxybenzoate polyprenyltransferase